MILSNHPDRLQTEARQIDKDRRFIGYWVYAQPERECLWSPNDYESFFPPGFGREQHLAWVTAMPNPHDYVDPSWDPAERDEVARRLDLGTTFIQWMGYSGCRICGESHGTRCLTLDGSFVWPAGFSHYVRDHNVRPPQEFIDHLMGIDPELLDELTLHETNVLNNAERWKPFFKGDHCPVKAQGGCEFEDQGDGNIRCEKGNTSSYQCVWASDMKYEQYKTEANRHADALRDLVKVPWLSGAMKGW